MALVRVYCGISANGDASLVGAPSTLSVAVVDDSGRLLEYCEIGDDARGYAAITGMLAERFGSTSSVMIAVESDDHLVIGLLAASGRQLAYTDDETTDDFAARYGDDESFEGGVTKPIARRAIGLARGLQAGAILAAVVPAPREYANLKPVLNAHAALAAGRQAAAVALREVLRELYPAALHAYPDPATPVALAMLDAIPEPSLLAAADGKGRDAVVSVAAKLVADGVCDNDAALDAVTALRVAINETPRRNGVAKHLTTAMADAVRASVAAVRSADSAGAILIQALGEKVAAAAAVVPPQPKRRVTPTPITTPPMAPRPVAPPPTAPEPIAAALQTAPEPIASAGPHLVPVAAAVTQGMPLAGSRPAWAAATPPPSLPPGFEPTPAAGIPTVPRKKHPVPAQRQAAQAPSADADLLTPFVPTLTNAAINSERAARGLGAISQPSADPEPTPVPPTTYAPAPVAAPGSRDNWPLVGDSTEDTLSRPGRVTPPWQADDLVMPASPPSLRLVETGAANPSAIPTRLVDDTALTAKIPKPRRTERTGGGGMSDDTDLLIFTSVSSAWFSDTGEGESTWNSSMDSGWRAAEEASLRPSTGGESQAGLPRRVPSANLVPGSAMSVERPLRIVRDAGEIATHTSNYFRGYRLGNQEAGGFAVGGRPGRESANGWDFSREHEYSDERDDYGPPRVVNYR